MPKITKKSAKKVVRKPATKKSTKKVAAKKATKRAYTRKPKTVDIKAADAESSDFAGQPSPEGEVDMKSFGEAIHQAAEAAVADNGQFSANDMLNLNVRNSVQAARGEVVFAIRNLVNASIELSDSASLSQAKRDVATARQRLAVAEFELAMDGLESAIRG